MPGPAPTPTNLLAPDSPRRKLRLLEPKPQAGTAARPRWLSKGARVHWDDLVEQLAALGVLTQADGVALALLADAIADYVAASKDVQERGLLVDGRENTRVKNPSVQFKNEAHERIIKLGAQFGLTPAARCRLSVNKPETIDNDEQRFFAAG